MNAVSALVTRSGGAASAVLAMGGATDILAAWRVQAGAVMVLGRARGAVPGSGVAQLQRVPAMRGVFRCLSWSERAGASGETGGALFMAAVRLPDPADPAGGSVLLLRSAGAEALTVVLPEEPVEDAAFGHMAARLAGVRGAAVARFVLEALRRPREDQTPELPHVGAMLRALLSQAAQADGCVEIMATVPDMCVLMQGWGARVSGPVQVVLAGAVVQSFAGQAGGFARSDTAAPATGVMLALPPGAVDALDGMEQVFILDEQGLHRRSLVEHRLLDPVASLGHVRHMLPQLRGPAAMLAMLQEAVRPRYDGRDTLSSNGHAVRAAVDVAAVAPGVGAYLSGWVFDPRRIVTALELCGPAGPVGRVDTVWNRVPRPDVSEAFRDEPGFPAPPDADAGFAVFLPDVGVAERNLHLQFSFADGERAFLPIRAEDPVADAFRVRLLGSVDLYKPSGLPIVERHVAPFLARVRPEVGAPARVLMAGPVERPDAVVVPLLAPRLPRALLSGLLHDAMGDGEQLVLVCGPEWDQGGLDRLRELVRFHGVPATVLLAGQAAHPLNAVRAAARATRATSFLVADPGVCGRAAGWRGGLRRAAEAVPGAAFVCPTLLYEDWSIRFAGATVLQFQDTAPFTHAHAAMAGMPAPSTAEGEVRAAHSGSLGCCLLLPAALGVLDEGGSLSTEGGREVAFFLRLQAAGLVGAWAPSVQVYAPENAVLDAVESRVGRLADGWMLREAGMALGSAA